MEQKGICTLSVIPLRAEGSDKSEMISQILFGETYCVLEKKGSWLLVRCDFDNYEGWIDLKQHTAIDDSNHKLFLSQEILVSTLPIFDLKEQKHFLLFGSSIQKQFLNEDNQSKLKTLSKKLNTKEISALAKLFLDTPYLWGGRSFFGIDCSGFSQLVYKVAGYKLQRDAYQQAEEGSLVEFSEIKEGDLAFFKNQKNKITHVGICLEGNKIIHASGFVRIDILDEKGIIEKHTKEISHDFHSIRRIIN